MAGSHDGRVTLSTKLDTSGIQAGAKGIKSALATSCKAVAALGAATAAAIVTVTKQSVDAYADFEQLTGGVETLFKESADKVKAYAEDAYKTAGVSANAYMETVTSFSASLISSLGGDTAKAADIANMAMVDMSDNANKMGTPLANIQTAYQGFAKQNYTMLDNLKLGYGGTKTEMERLLKDAQAFSGVKYDINNLGDVYEAIHQIQVKLGVAGTTAKEAENTITGSITMTKSAWENLLTAMSGGGSLDRAIDDFVYSLEKAMQNILPVVERSLVGIGYAIERLAPMLVERIAVALIKAIPSLLNAVYKMVIGLAQGVYQGIKALFSGSTTEVLEEQAEKIEASAENQKALTEEVKETEKATKKALAGFDELNVLSQDSAKSAEVGFSTSELSTGVSAGNINVTADVQDNVSTAIQAIIDKIMYLINPLLNIDFNPVMESFGRLGKSIGNFSLIVLDALEWAWFSILVPLSQWTIQEAAPAVLNLLSGAFDLLSAVLTPVISGLEILVASLKPMFMWIGETAIWILGQFREQFDKVAQVFRDKGPEIDKIISGLGAIVTVVWNLIEPVLAELKEYWGMVFDYLGTKVSQVVSTCIDRLSGVVEFFAGVFTGDWKRAVNGLIGIINSLISGALGSINLLIGAMNKLSFDIPDWVPLVGGQTFGFNIQTIKVPQIPYLARGAVLPANKPFLAMVGDQRHGTNVEAPLATIQEAVRVELGATEAAIVSAAEALIERQERILAAIGAIEVGDTTIGQAANRYNREMAIIKGGL